MVFGRRRFVSRFSYGTPVILLCRICSRILVRGGENGIAIDSRVSRKNHGLAAVHFGDFSSVPTERMSPSKTDYQQRKQEKL